MGRGGILDRVGRRRGIDDLKMNPAAPRASHGPVFGAAAAGDDAQDGKLGLAVRAVRPHRGGSARRRLGLGLRHRCGHVPAG
jgi:hypothetical protein